MVQLGSGANPGLTICGEWASPCYMNMAARNHNCSYTNREEGGIPQKRISTWVGGDGSGS